MSKGTLENERRWERGSSLTHRQISLREYREKKDGDQKNERNEKNKHLPSVLVFFSIVRSFSKALFSIPWASLFKWMNFSIFGNVVVMGYY